MDNYGCSKLFHRHHPLYSLNDKVKLSMKTRNGHGQPYNARRLRACKPMHRIMSVRLKAIKTTSIMSERNALDRIIPWAYVTFLANLLVIFDVYGREGKREDVEGLRFVVRCVCWGGLIPLVLFSKSRETTISCRDVRVVVSQAFLSVCSNSMTQFAIGPEFWRQCLHELSLVMTTGLLAITVIEGCIVERNLVAYVSSLGSVALCLYTGPRIYHEIQALGPWHHYYANLIIETILVIFHLSFFGRKPGTKIHRFNLSVVMVSLSLISELLNSAFDEPSDNHSNLTNRISGFFSRKN